MRDWFSHVDSGINATGQIAALSRRNDDEGGLQMATTPGKSGPIAGTHFSWEEVVRRSGYTTLPAELRAGATRQAKNMEKLRTELNKRRKVHNLPETGLNVLSWARSPKHNVEVGGALHSRHLMADACDIDKQEILRVCPWPGGAQDFDQAAETIFANGGLGLYKPGNRHVDSRGYHARWTSWTPGG
jgi:uncharacterized protein YcbK (DUF882 family)